MDTCQRLVEEAPKSNRDLNMAVRATHLKTIFKIKSTELEYNFAYVKCSSDFSTSETHKNPSQIKNLN